MVVSRKKSELTSSSKVYEHLKRVLTKLDEFERDKEHFYVILLNARNRAIITDLVGVGTLNASLVHPIEVFRREASPQDRLSNW